MAGQHRQNNIDVNTDDFEAALKAAFADMKITGEAQVLKVGIDVTNRAKDLCPVDTGRLRSAIQPPEQLEHDETGAYVDVGVTLESLKAAHEGGEAVLTNYGLDVEFGTEKMDPQPFMRPALAEASGSTAFHFTNEAV